jgi:hypothetical protein
LTLPNEFESQRRAAERLLREDQERQRKQRLEEQRAREEADARRKRDEFEKAKLDTLHRMKGMSASDFSLKDSAAGQLGLKEIEDVRPQLPAVSSAVDRGGPAGERAKALAAEPPPGEIRKSIDMAKARIPDIERSVKGLQTILRQYNASMRGNVSELEIWQETFNAAADNSWKNAREYGLSMFLQYNLLGSLESRVRKDAFGRLDGLINSTDPKIRRWLGQQLKKRNVELDRVKKMVTAGTLGGDLAALLSGDPRDEGKALDALLFVNDLLEATSVLSWAGSQYFQHAKMIGETYTDLAAMSLSCANVRELNSTTDAYNREIKHLSGRLRNSVKELNCLRSCLETHTERCLDRCSGKTRFGNPPPAPRR